MKKSHALIFILFLISISVFMFSDYKKRSHREKITNLIYSYQDSVKQIKGIMGLMRAQNVLNNESSRDLLKLEISQQPERLRLNRLVWAYNAKIDSLKLRLQQ